MRILQANFLLFSIFRSFSLDVELASPRGPEILCGTRLGVRLPNWRRTARGIYVEMVAMKD